MTAGETVEKAEDEVLFGREAEQMARIQVGFAMLFGSAVSWTRRFLASSDMLAFLTEAIGDQYLDRWRTDGATVTRKGSQRHVPNSSRFFGSSRTQDGPCDDLDG